MLGRQSRINLEIPKVSPNNCNDNNYLVAQKMKELETLERISLAKAAMSALDSGDWTELFKLTDCEFFPEENPSFFRDLAWQNSTLKQGCINAINEILDRDPNNLQHIWDMNGVVYQLKKVSLEHHKLIESIIDGEDAKIVETPSVANSNESIFEALADAETLLEKRGPQSAYDRMHTALHSCLRQICDNHGIKYEKKHAINELLPKISNHLKSLPDEGRNETVFNMLRSANAMLDKMNYLRNNNSLAHPAEKLLNVSDAKFAINLVKSIMTYVDELLS